MRETYVVHTPITGYHDEIFVNLINEKLSQGWNRQGTSFVFQGELCQWIAREVEDTNDVPS